MFSKQVWHDRKHQAEVFVTQEGVVSGTILSWKRGVCLVNPRPEVLVALYQGSKDQTHFRCKRCSAYQSFPGVCPWALYPDCILQRVAPPEATYCVRALRCNHIARIP